LLPALEFHTASKSSGHGVSNALLSQAMTWTSA